MKINKKEYKIKYSWDEKTVKITQIKIKNNVIKKLENINEK